MINRELNIINKLGLHARAAAKFVTTASGFSSNISLSLNGMQVNGKSIMGVMMLAAGQGSSLELKVKGDDEDEAVKALEALVNDRFEEGE
ncbi:MAG: HPr family phosphocarrier protein [Candidatus Sedimenticola sp. (ex Thyasira tokunagai)]